MKWKDLKDSDWGKSLPLKSNWSSSLIRRGELSSPLGRGELLHIYKCS